MWNSPSASGGNGSETNHFDRGPIGVFANEVNSLRIATARWKREVLTQKDIKEIERLNGSVLWKLDNLKTIGHPYAERVRQVMDENTCNPLQPDNDRVSIALKQLPDQYIHALQEEVRRMDVWRILLSPETVERIWYRVLQQISLILAEASEGLSTAGKQVLSLATQFENEMEHGEGVIIPFASSDRTKIITEELREAA